MGVVLGHEKLVCMLMQIFQPGKKGSGMCWGSLAPFAVQPVARPSAGLPDLRDGFHFQQLLTQLAFWQDAPKGTANHTSYLQRSLTDWCSLELAKKDRVAWFQPWR
jgi:hypothetical protein